MTRSSSVLVIALLSVALFSLSSARFLATTTATTSTVEVTPKPTNWPKNNVTYATNLTCGQCIVGGYVYCVSGAEAQQVTTLPSSPNGQYCCRNSSNCTYVNNTAWSCSNAYAFEGYGFFTCPLSTTYCGKTFNFNFKAVGNTTTFNITSGLPKGQACVYTLKAQCGAPAFAVSNSS